MTAKNTPKKETFQTLKGVTYEKDELAMMSKEATSHVLLYNILVELRAIRNSLDEKKVLDT